MEGGGGEGKGGLRAQGCLPTTGEWKKEEKEEREIQTRHSEGWN